MITKLPEELLEGIARDLLDDLTALENLCLVSQQLNRIVTPYLYRSFDATNLSRTERTRSIRKFLRTLITRPEMAAEVKTVSIDLECTSRCSPINVG